jgi:hypothetical protein
MRTQGARCGVMAQAAGVKLTTTPRQINDRAGGEADGVCRCTWATPLARLNSPPCAVHTD